MNARSFDIFRSVGFIWLLWAVSAVVLVLLSIRFVQLRRMRRSWCDLAACEEGASYTLSFVLTLPFFVLIICVVAETTLLLTAKIGSVYAAYAAARSAVVWFPSGVDRRTAEEKMHLAAAQAMVPFASGSSQHRAGPVASVKTPSLLALPSAHKRFTDSPAPNGYLGRKIIYADWAVSVETDAGFDPDQDVRVTLRYRAPFHIPAVGALFGEKSPFGGYYYLDMESEVVLENHAPRREPADSSPSRNPLGIRYVPEP